jgi:hypothetical protein
MSETATSIPQKGLGTVKWHDVLKGLYYISIGQILALVGFLVSSLLQEHPHFPTWAEWLPYVKVACYSIGGYITGKFGVNNVGQILKKDQPVVHIGADQLDELQQKADILDSHDMAKKNL